MDPSTSFEIVVADERQAGALATLVAQIEGRPVRKTGAEIERFLRQDGTWCVLALAAGRSVGVAVAVLIPKFDDRVGFLFLDELYVLPSWRRCGVGTALVRRATDLAEEFGLAGLRLLARPENDEARRLYERLGVHGSPSILFERTFERRESQS